MRSFNLAESIYAQGYVLIDSFFDIQYVYNLREKLHKATLAHNSMLRVPSDKDMVHNCHEWDIDFLEAMNNDVITACLSSILGHSYILYAFQSSSLPPNGTNYARRIHCDSPRLIPNYPTNIGVIITLDEYSANTGAISFLPRSHVHPEAPSSEMFDSNKVTLECSPGSIIIFNARTFHREGFNASTEYRHSLTANFCRCYMKQRLDFVRIAQSSGLILRLTESQRKLLGYNSRIPASMDEFFLPPQQRMYLSGQE